MKTMMSIVLFGLMLAFVGCGSIQSPITPQVTQPTPLVSFSEYNKIFIKSESDETTPYAENSQLLATSRLVQHTFSNGEKIVYQNIDGYVIADEVIKMRSEEVKDKILSYEVLLNDPNNVKSLGVGIKPSVQGCLTYFMFWCVVQRTFDIRWPNRTVYYDFDSNINSASRDAINSSIKKWKDTGVSVQWVYSPSASNKAVFTDNTSNINRYYSQRCGSSAQGMRGGIQPIFIYTNFDINQGGCSLNNAVHKLMGYTVGLDREETRCDANKYMQWDTQNVDTDYFPNFGYRNCKPWYVDESYYGFKDFGSFDYDSVMLSDQFAFSKSGMTLSPNPNPPRPFRGGGTYTEYTMKLYNNKGMSSGDIESINLMYQ